MRQGVVVPLRTQNNELKQMHENNKKVALLGGNKVSFNIVCTRRCVGDIPHAH